MWLLAVVEQQYAAGCRPAVVSRYHLGPPCAHGCSFDMVSGMTCSSAGCSHLLLAVVWCQMEFFRPGAVLVQQQVHWHGMYC
jgi:hypothetical protein